MKTDKIDKNPDSRRYDARRGNGPDHMTALNRFMQDHSIEELRAYYAEPQGRGHMMAVQIVLLIIGREPTVGEMDRLLQEGIADPS